LVVRESPSLSESEGNDEDDGEGDGSDWGGIGSLFTTNRRSLRVE
jgi:hypothetical protein